MINLRYEYGLIFCSLDLTINNDKLHLDNVLVDTGSATTLINSDYIAVDGTEIIDNAYGVGGYETILDKHIDLFKINESIINDFNISLGEMDYGIELDCILGLDALKALNADISIKNMSMEFL